jgi:superfamily II DNA or RNA helicase
MDFDTKFFTNTENNTLYDRFRRTLKNTQYFDVLVGYFRASGFYRLQDEFENIEKVRILIGLNVDKPIYQVITNKSNLLLLDKPDIEIKDEFTQNTLNDIANAENEEKIDKGILLFAKYLEDGKVEVKGHPSQNIHAKIYIMKYNETQANKGAVITGSSNFTESGLVAQREFNVELKDHSDIKFASEQFDVLWNDSIDLTKEFINSIKNKSHLRKDITPYELYIKFLYEYYKEQINEDYEVDIKYPDKFMKLKYQEDAVKEARRIIKNYGGVFLSDVVGLGKTYITSMLLQIVDDGRKLIICPPSLEQYWKETLDDFSVTRFDVISLGKLNELVKKKKYDRYNYIVVDEAHRFRNEMTEGFDNLFTICKGKKVILISATPLNNSLRDIQTQLKLFINMKNSPFSGYGNLENIFNNAHTEINNEKDSIKKIEVIKKHTTIIRENILRHIMVRRTRVDIKKYYKKDMDLQKLTFPNVEKPQRIIYEFEDEIDKIFDITIEILNNKKEFKYARYMPLHYLKKEVSFGFEIESEKNISIFMKRLLVKRLESSFYAFKNSIDRFVIIYENFIKMYKDGYIYIGKNYDIFSLLEEEDISQLEELIKKEEINKYSSADFNDNFLEDLNKDLDFLKKIQNLWKDIKTDPKLDVFLKNLNENEILKNKKLVIFTESKETSDYLFKKISEYKPNEVCAISGSGGLFSSGSCNFKTAKERIEENFKPQGGANDLQILITTNVLSEGVNLHSSNIIINYDLPWNPTRVLQRVGRVNRVGTEFDKIYIFNFFPTKKSDNQLGLEENIIKKINSFHSVLGEDAKYLSEEEELQNHGLSAKRFLVDLEKTKNVEDEEETFGMEYINLLRNIRDNDKQLFKKLGEIPKKINLTQRQSSNSETGLITYFSRGTFKRFVYSTINNDPVELTFNETVEKFKCNKNDIRIDTPKEYYNLLKQNTDKVQELQQQQYSTKNSKSHISEILDILDSLKNYDSWTDVDMEWIIQATSNIKNDSMSKYSAKMMLEELKKTKNQQQHKNQQQQLHVIISFKEKWESVNTWTNNNFKNEVILSKCSYGE